MRLVFRYICIILLQSYDAQFREYPLSRDIKYSPALPTSKQGSVAVLGSVAQIGTEV
jgi:hypothetical protein